MTSPAPNYFLPSATYVALTEALAKAITDGRPDIDGVASEILAAARIWDERVQDDPDFNEAA